MNYLKKLLTNFNKNENGVVAIIVALALVAILFGVLSLSIDSNRTQESYGHNHNATDAAALAGAEMWLNSKIDAIGKKTDPLKFDPSITDMQNYVKSIVIKNFTQDQSSAKFLDDGSFKVEMNTKRVGINKTQFSVRVEACAGLDTPMAQVAKHRDNAKDGKQRTCTSSKAAFELGKLENTEVAFALDFTESMYWKGESQACPPGAGGSNPGCLPYNQTKAAALQNAMNYVLDKYFTNTSVEATAFASIVPYTGFVNIYPYNEGGVVKEETDKVSFDGKTFKILPNRTDDYYGTPEGKLFAKAFYANAANAFSQYTPMGTNITIGTALDNYTLDPAFINSAGNARFTPFYTFSPYNGDASFQTKNYSYILNRVPVIRDAAALNAIINATDKSNITFDNYHNLVNDISGQIFVSDKTLSPMTNFSSNPNEQWAKMICYNYTIAAAADERVDGGIEPSAYIKGSYVGGKRDIELHESFPIQPLTSNLAVLKNVIERYVANNGLERMSLGLPTYDKSRVIDLQSRRLDKAHMLSYAHKTSSIHGLLWAWLSLRSDWQSRWDKLSLHEQYVGADKKSRDGSLGEKLPSAKNFKHIILISDGYDNDGAEEVSGGLTGSIVGQSLGRKNVCDAYTPIAPVSDDQYNNLCTAIKTNSTANDDKDDITIHTILLDYSAPTDNRFEKCASPNSYYNNVSPADLQTKFDEIFAGILTAAVPVRLIQ